MSDPYGPDLDRFITGGFGTRSAMGGDEDPWQCELCGNTDHTTQSDEEPVLCASCYEALER